MKSIIGKVILLIILFIALLFTGREEEEAMKSNAMNARMEDQKEIYGDWCRQKIFNQKKPEFCSGFSVTFNIKSFLAVFFKHLLQMLSDHLSGSALNVMSLNKVYEFTIFK